jgi:hypothetical protein
LIHRPVVLAGKSRERQKGAASMSTQVTVGADAFGAVPALLVVLMSILAMLGIVANVAMA